MKNEDGHRAHWARVLVVLCCAVVAGCVYRKADEDDDLGDNLDVPTGTTGTTGTTGSTGTTDPPCDGTWSRLEGQVTGPGTDRPAAGATVYAWEGEGGTDVMYTATTDSDGFYELEVTPFEVLYVEAYTDEGCWSYTQEVDAEACLLQTVDIDIQDCDVADKPNLYLYPETDTFTRVKLELDPRQKVVASIPEYRPRGWRGIAHTDGTWSELGLRVRDPFLFYEVSLAGWQARSLQRDTGWCIPFGGVSAVYAMADILADYGFDARERDDFVDAWVHDLPPSDSYAVYPQIEVEAYAGLDIRPALPIDRLWLVVDDGAGCAPRQVPEVVPFDRDGAHGVEWGVILGDLVR
ncbi:MAG: hypothetical protein CL927_09755 [Deltaproteobacteria bacterium]|nr:hypothetical protein [Deltaproteobacteria bacterium]HCH66398.1 hypothetical protein [Deltaproteobacteria bacterium]